MPLLLIAFVAGTLTVLAPCILPLLPVILGGTLVDNPQRKTKASIIKPLTIIASLCASIFVFSLALKASTALLGVPQIVWQAISASIIIGFGLTLLFPELWTRLVTNSGISLVSNRLLGRSLKHDGFGGDVLVGAALGPIFNSCSPTYALIIASILPSSFASGSIYLLAYIFGLGLMLFLVAVLGQKIIGRLNSLSDPKSLAHKVLAIVFILFGIAILFGLDKRIQSYLLDQGIYDPISRIEQRIQH